ncbi:MAG: glycyl-radical enzyme activating protein [Pseudomonadota bacterium]
MKDGRTALIVDIRRNALDDGPGIRTLVFFKGCPLSCAWCHNPETKVAKQELMFDAGPCISCGDCADACGELAIDLEAAGRIDRGLCTSCMDCVDACPSGALKTAGTEYTVEDLAQLIMKDEPFFRHSGGGVTFSGGEPAMAMHFLGDLAAELKGRGVHLNMETSGMFRLEQLEEKVLGHLDMIFYDIKFIDAGLHEKYTGKSNAIILDNFTRLLDLAAVPVTARVPLVPGITAVRENLEAIAAFLRQNSVSKVELLEYNPLWHDKAKGLGQVIEHEVGGFMSAEDRDLAWECFRGFDIL